MASTILALDTSTEACSVALLYQGQIISDFILSQREHTQRILPMVDGLLNQAGIGLTQLDAIAFGQGPGSFTGVRIGIGVAQGLAFGADKPLIAISTLATLAQGAYRKMGAKHVIAAIDARMHEVYLGQFAYLNENWQALGEERVLKPDLVAKAIQPCPATTVCYSAGSGWQTYPAMLSSVQSSGIDFPFAQDMLPLALSKWQHGDSVDAAAAEPSYLRNDVTWKKVSEQ